jgi:hypothetical protein
VAVHFRSRLLAAASTIAFFTLVAMPVRAQSQSASDRLTQVTIDAAGRESSSLTRRAHASVAQESAVGASSAPHFVLQSGFWSFVGSGLVPVVLAIHRNLEDRSTPDLVWTGNNAPYSVYRSSDCVAVFSSLLVSEPGHDYTDTSSFPSGLTCYNVLATAPGPLQLPPRKEPSP